MYSIGDLSKRAGVKVPTIRYYEQMGLISAPDRTEGEDRVEPGDRLGGVEQGDDADEGVDGDPAARDFLPSRSIVHCESK